jgi:dolichyl-phosphate beta-glucosyltransferase
LGALKTALKAFHENNCDIVTGSRDLPGSEVGSKLSMPRRLAGNIFSTIVQRMLDIDIKDTQCGFKGFKDTAAKRIFSQLETSGYAFDVEVFVRAKAQDMKICRIPVTLIKQAGSKIRLTRDPVFMLLELVKIARKAKGIEHSA